MHWDTGHTPLSSLLWVSVAFIYSGPSVAQRVTQVQPEISKLQEEKAILDCSYETTWSNYDLFWYKQLPSGEMIFLIRQRASSGDARSGRYAINFQKESKSVSLIISDLQLEDSAKYFCTLGELTVLEVIARAEQKLRISVRDRRLQQEPRQPHSCRVLTRRGPVVAEHVVRWSKSK